MAVPTTGIPLLSRFRKPHLSINPPIALSLMVMRADCAKSALFVGVMMRIVNLYTSSCVSWGMPVGAQHHKADEEEKTKNKKEYIRRDPYRPHRGGDPNLPITTLVIASHPCDSKIIDSAQDRDCTLAGARRTEGMVRVESVNREPVTKEGLVDV
ncbi:MAG: hypothetical protein Q9222_003673 [Ikaeria aurantiellina]